MSKYEEGQTAQEDEIPVEKPLKKTKQQVIHDKMVQIDELEAKVNQNMDEWRKAKDELVKMNVNNNHNNHVEPERKGLLRLFTRQPQKKVEKKVEKKKVKKSSNTAVSPTFMQQQESLEIPVISKSMKKEKEMPTEFDLLSGQINGIKMIMTVMIVFIFSVAWFIILSLQNLDVGAITGAVVLTNAVSIGEGLTLMMIIIIILGWRK